MQAVRTPPRELEAQATTDCIPRSSVTKAINGNSPRGSALAVIGFPPTSYHNSAP